MENGEITGRALINIPPNVECTHFVYFTHPTDPISVGNKQLPHPIRFDTPGVIEAYPITNPDLRLNQRQGIDYQ
jgi:hypothetical protein